MEILNRSGCEDDKRHASEFGERDAETGTCLLGTEPSALQRPGDPIQKVDDVARVRVRLVECG
jgi:hypothetical protein